MSQTLFDRIAENPFYVLGLRPDCSRHDVEREGQKLLAMLQLGLRDALEYTTPLGPKTRTPELVRSAMAELREPKRRLVHELLAELPAKLEAAPAAATPREKTRWLKAPMVFGYGPARESGHRAPTASSSAAGERSDDASGARSTKKHGAR